MTHPASLRSLRVLHRSLRRLLRPLRTAALGVWNERKNDARDRRREEGTEGTWKQLRDGDVAGWSLPWP